LIINALAQKDLQKLGVGQLNWFPARMIEPSYAAGVADGRARHESAHGNSV